MEEFPRLVFIQDSNSYFQLSDEDELETRNLGHLQRGKQVSRSLQAHLKTTGAIWITVVCFTLCLGDY